MNSNCGAQEPTGTPSPGLDKLLNIERPKSITYPTDACAPNLQEFSMSKTDLAALLRPEDSIVVLIDYQPYQFANPSSHDPSTIVNNVAVPMTWLANVSEWQRDWGRADTAVALTGVLVDHCGRSGITYAWDVKPLESAANAARAAM
jgi:hypothetical protein